MRFMETSGRGLTPAPSPTLHHKPPEVLGGEGARQPCGRLTVAHAGENDAGALVQLPAQDRDLFEREVLRQVEAGGVVAVGDENVGAVSQRKQRVGPAGIAGVGEAAAVELDAVAEAEREDV